MIATKQEIFNKVYLGLAKQKFVQAMKNGSCCYYDDKTKCRCAIGQLGSIQSAKKWQIIGGTIINLVSKHKINTKYVNKKHMDFLNELQSIHDFWSSRDSEVMKQKLEEFAKINKLKIPKLNDKKLKISKK